MRNLVTILAIILLASCNRHMMPTVQNETKDSIVITEKLIHIRDTTYMPGDTLEIAVAVPCPDAVVNEFATKGITKLSVKMNNGRLVVNCHTDSLMRIIDSLTILKNKEVYKTTIKTITIKEKVIKNKVPKWCWYLLAFNVLFLGWKFKTPLIGLVKKILIK